MSDGYRGYCARPGLVIHFLLSLRFLFSLFLSIFFLFVIPFSLFCLLASHHTSWAVRSWWWWWCYVFSAVRSVQSWRLCVCVRSKQIRWCGALIFYIYTQHKHTNTNWIEQYPRDLHRRRRRRTAGLCNAIHQRAQNKRNKQKILNSGPIGNEGRARRYLRPIKDETLNISFLSFVFDERWFLYVEIVCPVLSCPVLYSMCVCVRVLCSTCSWGRVRPLRRSQKPLARELLCAIARSLARHRPSSSSSSFFFLFPEKSDRHLFLKRADKEGKSRRDRTGRERDKGKAATQKLIFSIFLSYDKLQLRNSSSSSRLMVDCSTSVLYINI